MTIPEQVVRAIYAAHDAGDTDRVLALLGTDVVVRTYLAPGRVLRGHEQVRAALEQATDSIYAPHVDRYETLECGCVLGFGSVRYAIEEGGFVHHRAVWLCELEDGVVVSWTAFRDVVDAYQAHDCAHEPRLGPSARRRED
jgi:ketosteroid isomerase-like protein